MAKAKPVKKPAAKKVVIVKKPPPIIVKKPKAIEYGNPFDEPALVKPKPVRPWSATRDEKFAKKPA